MTPPPAATAAGHRRTTSRSRVAPRAPRRVSGPARRKRDPRAVARPAAATAAAGAAGIALPRPALRRPQPRRAVRAVRRLPDAPLLDRLISGRLWIGMVAFGLIGIVFMQVSLLKLNAGIGRAVEHAQTLERQNASLRASLSGLSSDDRVAEVASGLGMVTPDADSYHYVDVSHGIDAQRAARSIAPPKPGVMTASTSTPQTDGIGGAAAGAATPEDLNGTASSTPATGAPATATTAAAPPATSIGQAGQTRQTPTQQTQARAPAQAPAPASAQTPTATTAGGVAAAPGAGR